MAGIFAAITARAHGAEVTLVERGERLGGKIQLRTVGAHTIDAGPTVLTMPWVFRRGLAAAGLELDAFVHLSAVDPVARHAWADGRRLDLFADAQRSAAAIGEAFGAREAAAYRDFVAACRRIYGRVEGPFILSPRPTARSAWSRHSLRVLAEVARIDAHLTMRQRLAKTFADPALVQLFGRMSTYAGGAPSRTPATLNLIAHVETEGVWRVDGGIGALADGLGRALGELGATVMLGRVATRILRRGGRPYAVVLDDGTSLPCDAAVVNAPDGAIGALLGQAPPAPPAAGEPVRLSADTYCMVATTSGLPLVHHNVLFAEHPEAEFEAIFAHRARPAAPSVYVCAQGRGGDGPQPLFCLVNAPSGCHDAPPCPSTILQLLSARGLTVAPRGPVLAFGPRDFAAQISPGGAALYGDPPHGWQAFFRRPGSRTRHAGIYLCGGHTHPGPGLPMTALSGMQAADAWAEDCPSTSRSSPAAMRGGISTPRATTAASR